MGSIDAPKVHDARPDGICANGAAVTAARSSSRHTGPGHRGLALDEEPGQPGDDPISRMPMKEMTTRRFPPP